MVATLLCFIKSNLHYTRGSAQKRVTSGGFHQLSDWATQKPRSGGDTMCDLIDPRIQLKTARAEFNHYAKPVNICQQQIKISLWCT